MGRGVKIRGIYCTALTELLMREGYTIVEPSPEIRERFAVDGDIGPPDLVIRDRGDFQGVYLTGTADAISELVSTLRGSLLDCILMGLEDPDEEGILKAILEFPGASKAALDEIRSRVVPTVVRHHRLRSIDPGVLEMAERELARQPGRKEVLEREIFEEVILSPCQKASPFTIEHVQPKGKAIRPRFGMLEWSQGDRLLVRRKLSKGRYNGLNLPIEEGDYALSEVQEGSWFVRHAYYSKEGRLKGEYYNVNTPVELYPQRARYVDLEVDVVRPAGQAPFLVDEERLFLLVKEGIISRALADKAIRVAEGLMAGSAH